MSEQELDRNQAATPYKLEKARERGQVARSPDVVAAVVFMAAMVFLAWRGWPSWTALFRLERAVLAHAGRLDGSAAAPWALASRMLVAAAVLGAPFLATLVVAAIAANVLQTGGPTLSLEPVKADWSRLSPARSLGSLFSVRTLFNGARALLKLAVLSAVAYGALSGLARDFAVYATLPPAGVVRRLLADLAGLGLRLGLALCAIAVVDAIFTRREFATKMRMSRREVKEEVRHREGDPAIRSRLRELRRELLRRARSLQRTSGADVVITNPTHFAVALRYVHGEMDSPQLVAKGAGVLAAAMRQIAARHRIPVVQNPPLARALFHGLPIDRNVPPELYAQVARIIVWVFAARDARARGTTAVPVAAGEGA